MKVESRKSRNVGYLVICKERKVNNMRVYLSCHGNKVIVRVQAAITVCWYTSYIGTLVMLVYWYCWYTSPDLPTR